MLIELQSGPSLRNSVVFRRVFFRSSGDQVVSEVPRVRVRRVARVLRNGSSPVQLCRID